MVESSAPAQASDRARTLTRAATGFAIAGNALLAVQFAARFSALRREARGADGFDTMGEEVIGLLAMSGSAVTHAVAMGLAGGAGHHWGRATRPRPHATSRRLVGAGATAMIAGVGLFAAGSAMQWGFCPVVEDDASLVANTCERRWATGALFASMAGSSAMVMGAGMLGHGAGMRRPVSLSIAPTRTGAMLGIGLSF